MRYGKRPDRLIISEVKFRELADKERQQMSRLVSERPLLPIMRAFSLTRIHPSLYQSLSVTRRERAGESLRCASGRRGRRNPAVRVSIARELRRG